MLRLTLTHLLVNAALLAAGYYWLGLSDSRGLTLAWSALLGLLLLLTLCSAYGATFAFFCIDKSTVGTAWKSAMRNVLPLAVAAAGIVLLYGLLDWWQDFSKGPAFLLASFLTLTFRKPVAPSSVLGVFDAILFAVRWIVVPVFLVPMLAGISLRGWPGFSAAGGRWNRWRYWVIAPALLLAAVWAPFALLGWKPHMASFAMEMVSFALRATAAYLLFVFGWLLLAFATCAGKPSFTQPSTVVSP